MNRKQRRAAKPSGGAVASILPPAVLALFAEAVRHHQSGRLGEAEPLYRRVLASHPRHGDSLHLLGVICHQIGRQDEAVATIGRAIAVNPTSAAYHSNLGLAFRAQGRLAEAEACQRKALGLKPDFVDALINLGVVLQDQDRFAEAAECCRDALALKPDAVLAHSNLGNSLRAMGQLDAAAASLRRAIDLAPGHADAFNNLANVLKDQGRLDEAAECLRRAIALRPEVAEAHANLGDVLRRQGELDPAAAALLRALELAPNFAGAHTNLGAVRIDQGRLEEAAACHARALALKPDYADAHTNLGIALQEMGRIDEAIACHRRAVACRPDFARAHANLGVALILAGEYPEGWREYEWRFQAEVATRPFTQPRWNGEDLRGRTLLVWGEQGVGDEISFFAFLPELLERGARLVVECSGRLVPMLARALPSIQVVARQTPPDPRCIAAEIDFQIPAGSLCGLLRPSWPDFRPVAPYLVPDAGEVAELRRSYGGGQGVPLVGLSWTSRRAKVDRLTFSLRQWSPILRVPGVRFVSLQYGDHLAEITAVSEELGVPIRHDSTVDPLVDLDRTSAQIAAMDLVVTMGNSTQPLAAMLGKPVFGLMVRSERTELAGDFSPWEPSVRMFRQTSLGDWTPTIELVADSLRQWVSEFGSPPSSGAADRAR